MRPQRVSLCRLAVVLFALPTAALAQESYKIEPLKEAPPSDLAGEVRGALAAQGYKVVDGKGKTYAEFWLRKSVPASEKPSGPKGTVQFPFLAEGELLGALRYPAEGHDYRDQSIGKGVYTVRYGLQPVNGDHLGVSPFRDYALLLPAAKDRSLANVPEKPLHERSAEAAGTSHPAVLLLLTAPAGAAPPAIHHDPEKNTWGAVVPLNLAVPGSGSAPPVRVQLIVVGAAMA